MAKVYVVIQKHTAVEYCSEVSSAVLLGVYDNLGDTIQRVTDAFNEKEEFLEEVGATDADDYDSDNHNNGYAEIHCEGDTYEFLYIETEMNNPTFDSIAY